MLAEIICIGDELLIGQITDTNSPWIAQKLYDIGIRVRQITTVADKIADIVTAMTMAEGRADLVLLTGGLGPTRDDKTRDALMQFFNCGLRRDPTVLRHVEKIFQRSQRPLLEVNMQQADVLEIADVLFNEKGTAAGMWIASRKKHFVVLPGVPFEMKAMLENQVIPRLLFFEQRIALWQETLLIAGLGESFVAEKIADIEQELPSHLSLSYLPQVGYLHLRLSARGESTPDLQSQTSYYAELISKRLGQYFIAKGDQTLEQAAFDLLRKTNVTLSVAESCTGGRLAQGLTQIPGASQVFQGGAVTYTDAAKKDILGVKVETLRNFGAVSEDVVKEMALGAKQRFDAMYAIAVSGVAGPGGGTKAKPVGYVCIAWASPKEIFSKTYQFGGDRLINIERATQSAWYELIQMVRRENKDSQI